MQTWVGTVRKERQISDTRVEFSAKMVQVAASNLTTARKRVVEEACPEYGPRRSFRSGLAEGGKLPPGGEVLIINIRRVAKENKS